MWVIVNMNLFLVKSNRCSCEQKIELEKKKRSRSSGRRSNILAKWFWRWRSKNPVVDLWTTWRWVNAVAVGEMEADYLLRRVPVVSPQNCFVLKKIMSLKRSVYERPKKMIIVTRNVSHYCQQKYKKWCVKIGERSYI